MYTSQPPPPTTTTTAATQAKALHPTRFCAEHLLHWNWKEQNSSFIPDWGVVGCVLKLEREEHL